MRELEVRLPWSKVNWTSLMSCLQGTGVPLLFHAEFDEAHAHTTVPSDRVADPTLYQTFLDSRPDSFETSAIDIVIALQVRLARCIGKRCRCRPAGHFTGPFPFGPMSHRPPELCGRLASNPQGEGEGGQVNGRDHISLRVPQRRGHPQPSNSIREPQAGGAFSNAAELSSWSSF